MGPVRARGTPMGVGPIRRQQPRRREAAFRLSAPWPDTRRALPSGADAVALGTLTPNEARPAQTDHRGVRIPLLSLLLPLRHFLLVS